MTHHKSELNLKEIESKAIIKIVSFETIPTENGLKFNAQITVNGLGELLGLDARLFTVEIDVPETKKDDLSLDEIEQIIKQEIQTRLLPALMTTFGCVLAESVAAAFRVEPKATRPKVLKMYEKDFNQRNKIHGNKEIPMTKELLIKDLIVAWQRLEESAGCEIEKPSMEKLALEIGCSASQISRWIKDFVADFVVDGEPNYTHFLNMVQHKKKIREGKETLSIKDKKWLAKFSASMAADPQIIDGVPPEKRRNL